MPLSEEEMRLLEQMERALVEEDPKLASTLRGTPITRAARGRLLVAGVGFLAGIVLLMTGAVTQLTWLGIVGFLLMLSSATLGLTTWRGRNQVREKSPDQHRDRVAEHPSGFGVVQGGRKERRGRRDPKQASSGTFMQRMEQRWQRRRDQGGM